MNHPSYLLIQVRLNLAPNGLLHTRVAVSHVPVQREYPDVPLVTLSLLLGRELQQEALGASEDVHWVAVEPVLELVLAALHEDGHHVQPVSRGEQGWVVGDFEEHALSAEGALHFYFSLMFVERWWVFDVLSADEEAFDVGEGDVAGLVVFRYDDDWALLALKYGIDAHLLLLCFA